jgi:hypothetical protein
MAHYSCLCLDELRKTMKNLLPDTQSTARNSNAGLPVKKQDYWPPDSMRHDRPVGTTPRCHYDYWISTTKHCCEPTTFHLCGILFSETLGLHIYPQVPEPIRCSTPHNPSSASMSTRFVAAYFRPSVPFNAHILSRSNFIVKFYL